jgi:hypothetical protein
MRHREVLQSLEGPIRFGSVDLTAARDILSAGWDSGLRHSVPVRAFLRVLSPVSLTIARFSFGEDDPIFAVFLRTVYIQSIVSKRF